ncbi:hypothetical protein M9978_19770 [Sphingomonas sp. MG17]|uniref:Argininosuccinate lyase n=1 Tax=Sphingomonas tagetis TaxID=2949092 RepID=A0A9X2HM47_9SPHN|nr:hypothetical protein [Sphingomonas tagetis]MCP3732662.1 hypothetical protein [Sphingomonas tagetis]
MRTIIALAALTLAAAPALAEDWDFVLINGAGKPIKTIELAPAGSGNWIPNKVDPEMKREGTTKAGGRTTVHFDKATGQCRYDIKATFEDATSQIWTAANICDNSFITVKLAGDKATISAS